MVLLCAHRMASPILQSARATDQGRVQGQKIRESLLEIKKIMQNKWQKVNADYPQVNVYDNVDMYKWEKINFPCIYIYYILKSILEGVFIYFFSSFIK